MDCRVCGRQHLNYGTVCSPQEKTKKIVVKRRIKPSIGENNATEYQTEISTYITSRQSSLETNFRSSSSETANSSQNKTIVVKRRDNKTKSAHPQNNQNSSRNSNQSEIPARRRGERSKTEVENRPTGNRSQDGNHQRRNRQRRSNASPERNEPPPPVIPPHMEHTQRNHPSNRRRGREYGRNNNNGANQSQSNSRQYSAYARNYEPPQFPFPSQLLSNNWPRNSGGQRRSASGYQSFNQTSTFTSTYFNRSPTRALGEEELEENTSEDDLPEMFGEEEVAPRFSSRLRLPSLLSLGVNSTGAEDTNFESAFLRFLSFMREMQESDTESEEPLQDFSFLPTFKFEEGNEIAENICCICQDNFEHDELLLTLPCIHNFHNDCVLNWLKIKSICPLCKQPVSQRSELEDSMIRF